jgi:alkaline phosphatase D
MRPGPIGRRRFLGFASAALAAACTPGSTTDTTNPGTSTTTTPPTTTTPTVPALDPIDAPPVELTSDPFVLGVASGDPDSTSLILWTRLLGDFATTVPVVWEMAATDAADFSRLVATGVVEANPDDAMSVHVLASGLTPATKYIYRFRVGEFTSTTAVTGTMGTETDSVSIGVSSCQLREAGFWQAHDDIAAAELDLMVWLGDYTYRTQNTNTLNEFRELHASYRSDPALQAAHASCPWLVGLDDNDVDNDYTSADTGNTEQLSAAFRAWWEHQPTRLAKPSGPQLDVYRHLDLGALARIVLFDTRQYAIPGRDLLGLDQRVWADETVASDHVFTIFASPVIVSELLPGSPDLVPYGWAAHELDSQWIADKFSKVNTPVVVSGDLHTALVTAVGGEDGLPIAAELMAPAISSRLPQDLAATAPLLPFANEFVQHLDPNQGWLKLDISLRKMQATYRSTDASLEGDPVVTATQFGITAGSKEAIPES